MAWNSDSRIRDLEPYAKKHGYCMVVVYAVQEDGKKFTVTTYGRTKKLCKAAALAGNQLHDLVVNETWPRWPDTEPPDNGWQKGGA